MRIKVLCEDLIVEVVDIKSYVINMIDTTIRLSSNDISLPNAA